MALNPNPPASAFQVLKLWAPTTKSLRVLCFVSFLILHLLSVVCVLCVVFGDKCFTHRITLLVTYIATLLVHKIPLTMSSIANP